MGHFQPTATPLDSVTRLPPSPPRQYLSSWLQRTEHGETAGANTVGRSSLPHVSASAEVHGWPGAKCTAVGLGLCRDPCCTPLLPTHPVCTRTCTARAGHERVTRRDARALCCWPQCAGGREGRDDRHDRNAQARTPKTSRTTSRGGPVGRMSKLPLWSEWLHKHKSSSRTSRSPRESMLVAL